MNLTVFFQRFPSHFIIYAVIVSVTKVLSEPTNYLSTIPNTETEINVLTNGSINCTEEHCIRKCCPFHQVLDFGGGVDFLDANCVDSGDLRWKPEINFQFLSEERNNSIYLKHHPLICPENYDRFIYVHEEAVKDGRNETKAYWKRFELFPNGSIIVQVTDNRTQLVNSQETCVDGIQNFLGGTVKVPEKYSGFHGIHTAFAYCVPFEYEDVYYEDNSPKRSSRIILIYWVIMPFASLFILGTILIYILIWNTLNIHGYTLFSYICSLFGNYLVLFISQIGVAPLNSKICGLIGLSTHFFFLLTASWLTIVNFDVWKTFRHLKQGRPSKNWNRYLAYFSIAVGLPLLIVLVGGVLDGIYRNDSNPPIIIPRYRSHCVLTKESQAFYLYAPLGALVFCNLVFFVWTVFLLLSYHRSISAVLKGTCTEKEDLSLRLFLKLFVIMGFSWTFELIGWGAQQGDHQLLSVLTLLFDIFNILLAIPIFFIFVWKKTIFNQIWQMYPKLRKLLKLLVICGCADMPQEKRSSLATTGTSIRREGTNKRKSLSTASCHSGITNVNGQRVSAMSEISLASDEPPPPTVRNSAGIQLQLQLHSALENEENEGNDFQPFEKGTLLRAENSGMTCSIKEMGDAMETSFV